MSKWQTSYAGVGTELSSWSSRLSTLGRTSSMPRPAALRLGFSRVGGGALPGGEMPFSVVTLLEGRAGGASSVGRKEEVEGVECVTQDPVEPRFINCVPESKS